MRERLGILIGPKGRGTNMKALANACGDKEFPAVLDVIVSPKADSPAAEYAIQNGLNLEVIAPGENYADKLLDALKGCTILCLAGYTRLLPTEVLDRFPKAILNIHPALLPKYGGKGMYGMHVHEAILANQERESGCSVHYVTPVYDEGEVILQMRCPVLDDDTPETLAKRVLELEVQAYPAAVKKVIDGRRS